MEVQTFTIVCAWCRRVVKMAAAGASVSHTICPMCLEWTLTHGEAGIDCHTAPDESRMQLPDGYFGNAFKSYP